MRPLLCAAVLLAACIPEEGPLMAAGQDCVECHGMGGDARTWTAAGTWARGARVTLTDANGKSFTLRGNDVGNFYTAEPLAFPLRVSVDGTPMQDPVKYGGCNLCHQGPGPGIEPGPLMAPGRDCLPCHDGRIAVAFGAAGTWPGATTIQVGGITLTPNEVGNFYTTEPLPIPFVARVDGSRMEPDPTYGGCNRCHPFGRGADD